MQFYRDEAHGETRARAPVSVVIPHFESPETLRRALYSVSRQSLLPAQVIVVDDGSVARHADAAREIVTTFGNSLPVEFLQLSANRGPASARNEGWDVAHGRYVAFLDADDIWHPDKLHIQFTFMAAQPNVALTGHNVVELESGSEFTGEVELPPRKGVAYVSLRRLLSRNLLSTSSVVVRNDAGWRFTDGRRYSEDYELWLRIAASGGVLAHLAIPLSAMFKSPYGASGLSARLVDMEKGELDTFRRLRSDDLLDFWQYSFASLLSVMKFARRWMITRTRPSLRRG